MTETHLAYLSLGSNIEPEGNLIKAIGLLSQHGEIVKTSSVWESEPVGGTGPNYWNACVLFKCAVDRHDLKNGILNEIESQLSRKRSTDKYSPRTIDLDIILFDGESALDDAWNLAFVVVPLAEIHPNFQNPKTHEQLHETATRLRREVWLETRRGAFG
jgi:2-amino-4-hydroxy-6-hydroxymethyldihydropteridine diphosphokinase